MSVTYDKYGLPILSVGGVPRKLAALQPTAENIKGFRAFKDLHPVTDPTTWKECDYSFYGSPIRDQGTHGSCTGHAGVGAEDIVRRMMGLPNVLLSCTFPYAQVNGDRDQGASVSSILQVLKSLGTCTFDECGTEQIFRSQISDTAYTTAKKYTVSEAMTCSSFDEICEAVNRGYPVAFGIMIGANFSQLSPDGVCPLPNTIIGGHALCALGLKQGRTGTWLLKFQNSWSRSWGLGGYAYLSQGIFANIVDAYAIVHDAVNPDDEPPPIKEQIKPHPVINNDTIDDIVLPLDGGSDVNLVDAIKQDNKSSKKKKQR